MKKFGLINFVLFLLLGFFVITQAATSEDEISCPEKCVQKKENCELSCSQIVGGGAKSRERRECINDCGGVEDQCNEWCVNPTPRPTLEPDKFHGKPCPRACEIKAKDCYQICTKYTGGGAKSTDKASCRDECDEDLDNCNDWCVNPTPKPTYQPDPFADTPCPNVCKIKRMDCETNCSTYLGGGAKSGKRSQCMNGCEDSFDECSDSCLK